MFVRQVSSVNYRSVTVTFQCVDNIVSRFTKTVRYQVQGVKDFSVEELREAVPEIVTKCVKAANYDKSLSEESLYVVRLYDARFDKLERYWMIDKCGLKVMAGLVGTIGILYESDDFDSKEAYPLFND